MTIALRSLDDVINYLPPVPAYRADDPTWVPLTRVAGLIDMTSEGLRKMLGRYRNVCAHKEPNATFVHFPTFVKLYCAELHFRGN